MYNYGTAVPPLILVGDRVNDVVFCIFGKGKYWLSTRWGGGTGLKQSNVKG
jgi:hypothetical protein